MDDLTISDIHRLIDAKLNLHVLQRHTNTRQIEPIEQKTEPPSSSRNVREWTAAIDRIHDLIAVSHFRHYTESPQTSDLLDLARQLRTLVARYQRDDQ